MKAISSLSRYIQYIYNYHDEFTLFRGQPIDEPLIPRIGRIDLTNDLKKTEEKMFEESKLFSIPYLSVQPVNDWDWIALEQHHGLATRLLDWTENPLIALRFTVNKPPKKAKKGQENYGISTFDRNMKIIA